MRPILCPAGTYSSLTGLSKREECALCPLGYYCELGTTTDPVLCPAGRVGDAEGMRNEACNRPCPPGYWCGNGTTNATQNPCPANTFVDRAGAKSVEECQACGHHMNSTPGSRICKVMECPAGEVSPDGTYLTGGCTQCKPGTHDLNLPAPATIVSQS